MNKEIKFILMMLLVFTLMIIFPKYCQAVDLDEILNYTTTVSPRDDGTLDIEYHIEWKVLDSTLEGPLKQVMIGIPNQHVDSIKKISKNIKKIKYSSDGGNYVKIDFKDKYKAGETVTFEFSIHQSYMYQISNSKGIVSYEFTPGWFDSIKVDQAVIKWKASDIQKHNGKKSNDYIVWSRSLNKGEKMTAKVEYSIGRFNLDYNKQASRANSKNFSSQLMFFVIVIIIVTVLSIVISIASPSYYRHGGYGYYGGYYPYYRHHYHSSYSNYGGWRKFFRRK